MRNNKFSITVLGSGTSQGVPVIACDCDVCTSDNPKDKRLRSSLLVSLDEENYVIDSGPDFRQQMLREKVKSLRGILYTHEHKDHIAGMDDVRAFNYREKRDMELFCSEDVEMALRREFSYVFLPNTHPGIPKVNLNRINNEPFYLLNEKVIPIQVMHHKMPVFGFRIRDFVYITDAKTISEIEREKVRGTKIMFINSLRLEEHVSHFNLEEALAFIEDVKPEKAYLTHISHLFGKYEDIQKNLPENVFLAYDGLKIDLTIN